MNKKLAIDTVDIVTMAVHFVLKGEFELTQNEGNELATAIWEVMQEEVEYEFDIADRVYCLGTEFLIDRIDTELLYGDIYITVEVEDVNKVLPAVPHKNQIQMDLK